MLRRCILRPQGSPPINFRACARVVLQLAASIKRTFAARFEWDVSAKCGGVFRCHLSLPIMVQGRVGRFKPLHP